MNAQASILRDESAATMVEYAIMLAFIAAICITLVAAIGAATGSEFASFSSSWTGAR